jgi:hypothetical protein
VTQAGPSAGPRPSRPPSPEIIGTVVALAIIALVATTVLAATPGPGGGEGPGGASPTPSRSLQSSAPTPTPPVAPQVVDLLRSLNERLAASRDALQTELRRTRFRTPEVAFIIRQVNQRVAVGSEAVQALDGELGKDEPGGRMAAVYGSIADTATETLGASINNSAEYESGARTIVAQIAELSALQAALDELARPQPTVAPTSPPPSTPPSPSTTASASTRPSASPLPTGSPSEGPLPPAGDEQVVNGGFEQGVGPPWGLFLGQGAAATLAPDNAKPGAGSTSARVDITAGSQAYSGISLRQPGLKLEAGRLYTLSVAVRAASQRDIRVRVASTTGASYVNRIAQVGTAWSTVAITFTAGVGDPNAVLELDLGRGNAATLFDAVSFRPIGG